MKQITAYEIVDHGIEHSDYFSGCGVAFTKFTDIATGIGNDFSEAIEDALDSLAQQGYDTESISVLDDNSAIVPEGSENVYYYVSIRVRSDN